MVNLGFNKSRKNQGVDGLSNCDTTPRSKEWVIRTADGEDGGELAMEFWRNQLMFGSEADARCSSRTLVAGSRMFLSSFLSPPIRYHSWFLLPTA